MNATIEKALALEDLERGEAIRLYMESGTAELMWLGHEIRKKQVPGKLVGWIIDRNVNITNVCVSRCSFCNFHRLKRDADAYITSLDEYREKITTLFELGGDQLLLQGGLHPDLGLDFYVSLFSSLKKEFPDLKLHALGPPEIHYLSEKEGVGYHIVLDELIKSGLDSLPGAGAEILCDEVRSRISGGKSTSDEWLAVMREAHKMNLPTSATMMYGHVESSEQRIDHLLKIRNLQKEKPVNHHGFISFIPWPFQAENTRLKQKFPGSYRQSAIEYLRLIAISRILLNNVGHVQASWLTVGLGVASVCLHAGADDLGSIMIEENVVSAAGASFRTTKDEIQNTILKAGFIPRRRNQKYETIEEGYQIP